MKKLILFLAFIFALLIWGCNREKVIESTPPEGVWEELIWIKDANGRDERITFHKMNEQQQDTLVYVSTKFRFVDANTVEVETRYGDGQAKLGNVGITDCLEDPVRKEYFKATYTTERDVFDKNKDKVSYINVIGGYTWSDYVSPPDPCSSTGSINRRYDYRYENEEKTLLRLGYHDETRWRILLLEKQ